MTKKQVIINGHLAEVYVPNSLLDRFED